MQQEQEQQEQQQQQQQQQQEEEEAQQGEQEQQAREQVEQQEDVAQTTLVVGALPADEQIPAPPEAEPAAAAPMGSIGIPDTLDIALTVEEGEQLRANLAAAAAELQAEEQCPMGPAGAGSSWVVIEQKHVQPVTDGSGSPSLREWV